MGRDDLKPEGHTVSESTASEEAVWEGFKSDAARVLNATARYEHAIAESLECTFDDPALNRVEAAIAELRAARPTAIRLAGLDTGGI